MQRCTHVMLKVLIQVYGPLNFCSCKQSGHRDSRNELVGGHLKDPYKINLNTKWKFHVPIEGNVPLLVVLAFSLCNGHVLYYRFLSKLLKVFEKNMWCTWHVTFLNWYLAVLMSSSASMFIFPFFLIVKLIECFSVFKPLK